MQEWAQYGVAGAVCLYTIKEAFAFAKARKANGNGTAYYAGITRESLRQDVREVVDERIVQILRNQTDILAGISGEQRKTGDILKRLLWLHEDRKGE